MVIKTRKNKPPVKRRRKEKLPPTIAQIAEAVERFGALLEAGHGTQADANFYFTYTATDQCDRMQSIAATAEKTRSWEHLLGCYTQAMTLFVYAGILYEKYPEHTIMTDGAFDKLGRWLLEHFEDLSPEFRQWYQITTMGLEAGTALGTIGDTTIRWMISIHTKIPLEKIDASITSKRSRPVRGKPVRGSKRPKVKPRKAPRKRL